MTYAGSKAKYVKYIAPILQKEIEDKNIKTFIDCCCGGCNIIKDIKAEKRIGIDKNENWIAFLKQITDGSFVIPEKMPTRDEWDSCKFYPEENDPAMVGFIGVFCSYTAGGYYMCAYNGSGRAQTQYTGRVNTLKKELDKYKGIDFIAEDYHTLLNYSDCLIYVDPPYAANDDHPFDADKYFDHEEFWNTMREVSKNNIVYISEQEAPEDFEIIWENRKIQNVFGKEKEHIERLYKFKGDDNNE